MPSKQDIMETYGEVDLKRAPLDDRIVRCVLSGMPMLVGNQNSWMWKYVGYGDNHQDTPIDETYRALKNVMWHNVLEVLKR